MFGTAHVITYFEPCCALSRLEVCSDEPWESLAASPLGVLRRAMVLGKMTHEAQTVFYTKKIQFSYVIIFILLFSRLFNGKCIRRPCKIRHQGNGPQS